MRPAMLDLYRFVCTRDQQRQGGISNDKAGSATTRRSDARSSPAYDRTVTVDGIDTTRACRRRCSGTNDDLSPIEALSQAFVPT